jgi:HlyD family secretion protein
MSVAGKLGTRVVVGASILALGGAGGWVGGRRVAVASAHSPGDEVRTALVGPQRLSASILATGVIRPQVGAQVAVGSRVSGVLRRLHVTAGERVQAGQLLAELDRREAETALERASAALETAQAEQAFASREFERARQLTDGAFIPPSELSAAQRALEVAQARAREAAGTVSAAQVQLEYTQIRAPISGVVGSISTQEGETIAASLSAPTFLTIVDLSRLEVWAYVDETDVGLASAGLQAVFTVSTYPDVEFSGRVVAVRPTAEIIDNVVSYITRLTIADRQGRLLRPEMTANVRIEREGSDATVAVPNGALRRDAAGTYVLVSTPAGLERRDVRVGFRGGEHAEILAGLTPGERVTVGSLESCQDTGPEGGA